jgi:hypothetical protein
MSKGIAVQLNRDTGIYTGVSGWGQSQPELFDTTGDYIEAAYQRREAYKTFLDKFTKAVGQGVVVIDPCVKAPDSAERKLWDRTTNHVGRPEMIHDYLRASVISPNNKYQGIGSLIRAIEVLKDQPELVGYKDQFWRPERETGYRSFKAVLDIDGHHSELILNHEGMLAANRFTDGVRSMERALRELGVSFGIDSSDKTSRRMVTNAEVMIGSARDLRKMVHDFASSASGMDVLMDPALFMNHKPPTFKDLGNELEKASKHYFGKRIVPRLRAGLEELAFMNI